MSEKEVVLRRKKKVDDGKLTMKEVKLLCLVHDSYLAWSHAAECDRGKVRDEILRKLTLHLRATRSQLRRLRAAFGTWGKHRCSERHAETARAFSDTKENIGKVLGVTLVGS